MSCTREKEGVHKEWHQWFVQFWAAKLYYQEMNQIDNVEDWDEEIRFDELDLMNQTHSLLWTVTIN
jgi:hypothetical protein